MEISTKDQDGQMSFGDEVIGEKHGKRDSIRRRLERSSFNGGSLHQIRRRIGSELVS